MKQIDAITPRIFQVVSEPGDATRYEYLVFRDGPEEYTFCPTKSTFNYPQRLNKWLPYLKVSSKESIDKLLDLSSKFNCNPNTVLECLRTIEQIDEDYSYES